MGLISKIQLPNEEIYDLSISNAIQGQGFIVAERIDNDTIIASADSDFILSDGGYISLDVPNSIFSVINDSNKSNDVLLSINSSDGYPIVYNQFNGNYEYTPIIFSDISGKSSLITCVFNNGYFHLVSIFYKKDSEEGGFNTNNCVIVSEEEPQDETCKIWVQVSQ